MFFLINLGLPIAANGDSAYCGLSLLIALMCAPSHPHKAEREKTKHTRRFASKGLHPTSFKVLIKNAECKALLMASLC